MSGFSQRFRTIAPFLAGLPLVPACIAQVDDGGATSSDLGSLLDGAKTFQVPEAWAGYCTVTFDVDHALTHGDDVVPIAAGSTFVLSRASSPTTSALAGVDEQGVWTTVEIPNALLGPTAHASCVPTQTRQHYALLDETVVSSSEFGGETLCTLPASTVIPQAKNRCFDVDDERICRFDLSVLAQPCGQAVGQGYMRASRSEILPLQTPQRVLTAISPGDAWQGACTVRDERDLTGEIVSFDGMPGDVQEAIVHIPSGTPLLETSFYYTALVDGGAVHVRLLDPDGEEIYPESDCDRFRRVQVGVFADLTVFADDDLTRPLCALTVGQTSKYASAGLPQCDLTHPAEVRCEMATNLVSAFCPEHSGASGYFRLPRSTPFATVSLPVAEVHAPGTDPAKPSRAESYTAPSGLDGCVATFSVDYDLDDFFEIKRIEAGSTFVLSGFELGIPSTHELTALDEGGRLTTLRLPKDAAAYELSCDASQTRHFVGVRSEVAVYAQGETSVPRCTLSAGTVVPMGGRFCSRSQGVVRCEVELGHLGGPCGTGDGTIVDTGSRIIPFLAPATVFEARDLFGAFEQSCSATAQEDVTTVVASVFGQPGFVNDAVVHIAAGTPVVATVRGQMALVDGGVLYVTPGNDSDARFEPRCTRGGMRRVGVFDDVTLYTDASFSTPLCRVAKGRSERYGGEGLAVLCDDARADQTVCEVDRLAVRALCPERGARTGYLRLPRPTAFASVPTPIAEFYAPE